MDSPTASDVANLQREVSRLALAAAQLGKDQRMLSGQLAAAVRSVRRMRLMLVVLGLVVLVTAGTAVSGVYLLRQQHCVNGRSARFFAAEQAKVQGQVDGLTKLRAAGGNRAKALKGFDQFIDASQHYLDTIATLPKC